MKVICPVCGAEHDVPMTDVLIESARIRGSRTSERKKSATQKNMAKARAAAAKMPREERAARAAANGRKLGRPRKKT